MAAGHARLEVHFTVDENGLLTVVAREIGTGVSQSSEVTPSYGLDEERVELLLLAALDHGGEDCERRRLVEARVEAERMLLATEKGLGSDRDLLQPEEAALLDASIGRLKVAIASGTAGQVQSGIDDLDAASHEWAGRRMNRAIQGALGGRAIAGVEQGVKDARGVDAHVEEHNQRGPSGGHGGR
jgi:molecular chaperone HscA